MCVCVCVSIYIMCVYIVCKLIKSALPESVQYLLPPELFVNIRSLTQAPQFLELANSADFALLGV